MFGSLYGNSWTVVVLLAEDADMNQANSEGATPIILSSGNGRQVVVKLLLDKGATVDRTRSITNKNSEKTMKRRDGGFNLLKKLYNNFLFLPLLAPMSQTLTATTPAPLLKRPRPSSPSSSSSP